MTLAIRRTSLAAAVLLAALLLLAAAPAGAQGRGLFGLINQTPLTADDVEPLREAHPASFRFLALWEYVQEDAGRCTPSGTYAPGTGPAANNCDWDSIDEVVGNAASAGVRTLPFLFGSPDWLDSHRFATASSPWAPPLASRSDRVAWKRFVMAAVNRYGRGGAFWAESGMRPRPPVYWQIWNEPTSPTYFAPRPSVSKYVKLLKLAARAVNRADRLAKVMLAGVFGTPRGRGGGIDMPDFFRRLYGIEHVERLFDMAAIHPYSPGIHGMRYQVRTARKLMDSYGDKRTGLYVSEMGWASDGPTGHTLTSTPKGQARLLRKAFALLLRKRRAWRIGGVNWFSWRDAPLGQSSCSACPWAGLLRLDGSAKPAYRAFKSFTR